MAAFKDIDYTSGFYFEDIEDNHFNNIEDFDDFEEVTSCESNY